MLFEKDRMEKRQHQMTFENSHHHQIQNSKIKLKEKQFSLVLIFILFTRFRRGSCLVPAGRGGVVFLNKYY